MAERFVRSDSSQSPSEYINLPDSLIEASRLRRQHYNHIAMRMIGSSIEAKRACNEAIIFTYGVTGTGASATLNHLFNYEIIPTSDSKSQTTSVTEYVSTLRSDEWKADNLRICFIDPPGFGDTKGDHKDIMNLATIEEFISKQRHLGTKFYKCYPNIVLITVNANDYRMQGEHSQFNIMLNALRHFELVDTRKPNLVIAMTHVMSIPKSNFTKRVQEQSDCIQKMIQETFGIEASIVYVENSADAYALEKDGDWTVLADGTRQPLNLFEAMIKVMKKNGDEVGVEATRLFFPDNRVKEPKEGMVMNVETANEEKMQRWSRVVIHRKLRIQDSECTIAIRDHQSKNLFIPKDALLPLMSELNRAKVSQPNQIREKSISDVQRLLWPYQLTPLDKEILIRVFAVQPAQYRQFLDEISHGCYTNEMKPTAAEPMFNFTKQKEGIQPCNGVYLPDCMEIRFVEDTTVYCYCPTLTKSDTLISDNDTSISVSEIQSESVLNKTKQYTFVFMVTHTVFTLTIQSPEKSEKYLNPELKKSVYDLPEDCIVELTEDGATPHPLYLDFLKKYGHCFLTHWEGGGIVSGQITVEIFHLDIQKTEGIIKKYLRMYFTSSDITKVTYQEELVNTVVRELHAAKLTWKGGSAPLVKDHILDGLDPTIIETWKRSLLEDPTPLENIQLSKIYLSVYEIVRHIKNEICAKLKQVLDIVAPEEYDIDDILSEMEAEHYLTDNVLFEVKKVVEHSVKPDRRSRRYSFLNEEQILREYCNITLEDVLESTRVNAALRARSNTIHTTHYGFPENAKVWRKKYEDYDPEEIEMRNLEMHDLVECVSHNQLRLFVPVLEIFKIPGDFQFIQADHDHGNIVIGEFNYIIKGNRLKKITARKLKIGDRLVWAEPRGTKIKTTHVKQLSLVRETGNIQPIFNDNDFVYIIVNGIVCGRQGSACFPGNASVVLRGGERVRMDELKIGDHVLSIHPTTGKPVYSKVYLWAHRDPHTTATFLHITHPHGHLHISANHLILSGDERIPVPADQLRVGDSVHFLSPCLSQQQMDGEEGEEGGDSLTLISVPVLHIQTCTQVGYYAPFTNNGLIVVDGIAASVYSYISTHSQSDNSSSWLWSGVWHSVMNGLVQQFGMHRVGQCVLTPVRVGCKLGVGSLLSHQMDTNTHIHKYCQWLLNLI